MGWGNWGFSIPLNQTLIRCQKVEKKIAGCKVFPEAGTDTWPVRVMSLAEASVSFENITKGKEFKNKSFLTNQASKRAKMTGDNDHDLLKKAWVKGFSHVGIFMKHAHSLHTVAAKPN